MPSAIAAVAASSFSFDFGKSSEASAASFASKLLDARQNLPSKPAAEPPRSSAADDRDVAIETETVESTGQNASDTTGVDRAEASQADIDAPVEEATKDSEVADKPREAADPRDEVDEALMALLASSGTPAIEDSALTAENAVTGEAEPMVAAATLGATAATVVSESIATETEAASTTSTKPLTNPEAAASAKPSNKKIDELTAGMTPTDGEALDVPLDAAAVSAASRPDAEGEADARSSDDNGSQAMLDRAATSAEAGKPGAEQKSAFDDLLSKLTPLDPGAPKAAEAQPAASTASTATPLRPEQQFAKDNVDRVVGAVHSQVNAAGDGQMRVRLDPPELGALDVAMKMVEGKMTASFTTSNDQATQLLSHNLSHLKQSLEHAGIAVDRLEVRQAAPTSNAGSDRDSAGQQGDAQRGFGSASQQQSEQQRKQMVDRLWRKYAYGSDEVDLVA